MLTVARRGCVYDCKELTDSTIFTTYMILTCMVNKCEFKVAIIIRDRTIPLAYMKKNKIYC